MFLYYAMTALHVLVCIILVLVVLLQSGRGADLAGAFGGGATQTAFGSRGPASFLSKMTTIAAVVFMLTSIGLSMISTKTETKSVLETTKQQNAQPAEKPSAPAAAPGPALTPDQIEKRVEELERKQQQQTPAPSEQRQPDSKPAEPSRPAN